MTDPAWISELTFTDQGLIPAIAQDAQSKRILMFAWMNKESIVETVESGQAVYWSRSRQALWRKGEISGHHQLVEEIRLDCDGDVITLLISQIGGIACHTGRESCFFRVLKNGEWTATDSVLKSPEEIYSNE
ncbi:MAG: phosphoribosyl-AMP cyclohydrolase [Candidatus Azotimanducaceae bacterium]|jgi:phosphoribosyl-AMP cyclohydrolase